MNAQQNQELSRDERLGKILAEWLEAVERGDAPDPQEYLRRYPEFADELPQHFADWERFPRVAAARTPVDVDVYATIAPSRDVTQSESLLGQMGDYELLREVGRGGMGVVYEARQISLDRRVALKVLPFAATMDAKQLQRFHNEARAAAALEHPHIVPVYGVGCERGVHYYAMRLIDGQTLADLIARQGSNPVPAQAGNATPAEAHLDTAPIAADTTGQAPRDAAFFRRAAEWGRQAAEAIEYAHSLGIVHRDIKPANLMIDAAGHLWVTDFGLARTAADTGLTVTGDLLGTLRYMSPEQALAKHGLVDHRTDIYALGATLYELLTGQPAVEGSERREIMHNLADSEPRLPSQWNRAIPAELETIILKALSKEPAGRYATAQEMADDLGNFLEDRPIRARRVGRMEKAWRWCRRNPMVASLAAAVAFVLVAGATASTGFAIDASLARDVADANAADAKNKEKEAEASAKKEAEERLRAEANAKIAKDSEAETKAVLDFVVKKIFAAARPKGQKGGQGHDVTLRKAIEAALPFVETAFKDQPIVEARLRMTIGNSFTHLGEAKNAAAQYETARALYTKHRGPDHPDTLGSMNNVANSYYALGRYADALKLYEETLAIMKAKLGPEHPNTLASMGNLAGGYAALGRHADALELRKETLKLQEDTLGPDHSDTLEGMHNLALSFAALGRHADALTLNEATLKRRENTLGPEHPETLMSMYNLAGSYDVLSRHEEALKLHEKTLELRRKNLGHDHPDTINSMDSLAVSYFSLGRHPAALELFKDALDLRKIKPGPDDPATLRSMGNLAGKYADVGQYADSLKLCEEALAQRKSRLGPDNPATVAIAKLMQDRQRLMRLDLQVPAVLKGDVQPVSVQEWLDYVHVCQRKKAHARAVQLWNLLFLKYPAVADDAEAGHRYFAACDAALALSQDRDAGKITDAERVAMRKQAYEWIHADLDAWRKQLQKKQPNTILPLVNDVPFWQKTPDLAAVRDEKNLAKLPEAERKSWQKLWADVEQIRKQADSMFKTTTLSGWVTAKEREPVHDVKLKAGTLYVIGLQSTAFNTFLRLENAQGESSERIDGFIPGSGTIYHLIVTPPTDGTYRLVVSAFDGNGVGPYTLTIREFVK